MNERLRDTYERDLPETYEDDPHFEAWLDANYTDLQEEFLKQTPPEEHPLDDEMSDWFNSNDEYMDYCNKEFKKFVDAGGLED